MLQGKNLLPADINGYSDPYVTLLCWPPPASRVVGKPARWRTKTIARNSTRRRCDAQVPAIPLLSADLAVIAKEHLLFPVMDEDALTMDETQLVRAPAPGGRRRGADDWRERLPGHARVLLTQFGRVAGELHA